MKKLIPLLIIGIVLILLILIGCDKNIEIPYKGEPCKELDFSKYNCPTKDFIPINYTYCNELKKEWEKEMFEIRVKGYCKNGTRIGGIIGQVILCTSKLVKDARKIIEQNQSIAESALNATIQEAGDLRVKMKGEN